MRQGEMRMIRTYVPLVPSHPVLLVADLVNFDIEPGNWDR
jgi:hypothetical protein